MGGSTKLPSNTMLFFTYQKLRRQINMCMHISLRPGYVQIYNTSVRFFNVCHPFELKCDFSIINEFNSNRIKLHYSRRNYAQGCKDYWQEWLCVIRYMLRNTKT